MKSLFNTSCDKDLVDFRQFWLLKETFWQNSYRIFRFWYRYMLFQYEIGKIAHLVSHQVSRDLLKETFRTKVSLSKQVSYKTWRKRTKSVKSHISFLSEVSRDVLKETFCRKVSFRWPKLFKKSYEKVSRDVLKETFRTKVSLSKQVSYKTWWKRTKSVKSHISFLSEVSRVCPYGDFLLKSLL